MFMQLAASCGHGGLWTLPQIPATSNKCIATSIKKQLVAKCLTTSKKKLLVASSSYLLLVVMHLLLVVMHLLPLVPRSYTSSYWTLPFDPPQCFGLGNEGDGVEKAP